MQFPEQFFDAFLNSFSMFLDVYQKMNILENVPSKITIVIELLSNQIEFLNEYIKRQELSLQHQMTALAILRTLISKDVDVQLTYLTLISIDCLWNKNHALVDSSLLGPICEFIQEKNLDSQIG